MDLGTDQVVLRPSLCPHHALIYRSRARSYRELPLRIAELGGMYRSEPSGVLGGLTRVRAIQLNDAHIFCPADQVAEEARAALDLIRVTLGVLGVQVARYRLSLLAGEGDREGKGAAKYVADPHMWKRSGALLRKVLDRSGLDYETAAGEAAFYGPKVDVQIADGAGRDPTLSTVQIDLFQPQRFDLRYTGPDGDKHRPVMVHRSIIGSLERLVADRIEVYGGAFPGWLAPVQVLVLPISAAELSQASEVARRAVEQRLRAEVSGPEDGSLGTRIRAARLAPYQAVIGAREARDGRVALRLRSGRRLEAMPADEALRRISDLTSARSAILWDC